MARHIKKYENSAQKISELQSGVLDNPYVASLEGVLDWNSEQTSDYTENYNSYFWVRSPWEATLTPSTAMTSESSNAKVYYSTDTGETKTWTEFTETIQLSSDRTYFKGDFGSVDVIIAGKMFDSTGQYMIGGNIMSLFVGDDFKTVREFQCTERDLFKEDTNLIDASYLCINVDKVGGGFNALFAGCTGLTSMPKIIYIRELGSAACYGMFCGCTQITKAVVYVEKNDVYGGFAALFQGCSSLNDITCLTPSNPGGFSPFSFWVQNVAANGTFTKNKNATFWESGASGIPSGWTVVDSI